MVNADVILGIVTSLISVIWIVMSLPMPGGTVDGVPGPGYFPITLSSFMILLSVILIYTGFKNKKVYFDIKSWSKDHIIKAVAVCIILLAYLILWPYIPFVIICGLMLFALGRTFKLNLITNICLTLCLTAFSYYVFNDIFHVILNI